MTPASAHLAAALEERPKTARYWLGVALALVTQEAPPMFDLVVTRRDTGREVLRTIADVADPGDLLTEVERDLATKTVEEFVAEWRVVG